MPRKTENYLTALKSIFESSRDKHEANFRSSQVMADMSGDRGFFTEVLERHISREGNLNTLHYPVVGIDIELNENFGLVANCWIPLPDRATNVSTKAIHHHGDMLLTTTTAFGTGYEHWTFETPTVVDANQEIYELKILDRSPHPLNHVAFVDAWIAHLPLYPPDLTITYALWSSRFPTNWKDRIKRNKFLQKNKDLLKGLARRVGLSKELELKDVEYFDFYPCSDGFRGIRERKEFERTTNDDYLASLFHVIQRTGNESLAARIRDKLASGEKIDNPDIVSGLVADLESGKPIEGRLSAAHYGVPGANFTEDEILAALKFQSESNAS